MFSGLTPKSYTYMCLLLAFVLNACTKINETGIVTAHEETSLSTASKKNVIIILADDIGYELPTYTGGESYSTANLDFLSKKGMQFTHCYASAMCSPSRVMLLTGKYGFRNYQDWGILDTAQKTIANMLQDHNYATCVTGKWQLDGGDAGIHKFGFDEYCVFDPVEEKDSTDKEENLHRYKNPTLYQNGSYLPPLVTKGKYSDDIFAAYASGFIERNKENNFFLYFSFSECHLPFTPPPNNPDYPSFDPLTELSDKKYFPYMVSYMDSKINTIVQKVADAGLLNKTYIFIMADNGTTSKIISKYKGRQIQGGKSYTTEFGLHVPLIALGPGIKPGSINKNIVDFTDFMPTVATIANIPKAKWSNYGIMDGQSFFNQLSSPDITGRSWSYGNYFPYLQWPWQKKVYVQDTAYKLYDETNNNNFYNLQIDSLEQHPIPTSQLTASEKAIRKNFKKVLATMHN